MMFDNREKGSSRADRYAQEDSVLLMSVSEGSGEAEPVLVTRAGGEVTLTLHTGQSIVLDALELAGAVRPRLRVAA